MSTQPAPESPKPVAQTLLERILEEEVKQTKHLDDVARAARTYSQIVLIAAILTGIAFTLWLIIAIANN